MPPKRSGKTRPICTGKPAEPVASAVVQPCCAPLCSVHHTEQATRKAPEPHPRAVDSPLFVPDPVVCLVCVCWRDVIAWAINVSCVEQPPSPLYTESAMSNGGPLHAYCLVHPTCSGSRIWQRTHKVPMAWYLHCILTHSGIPVQSKYSNSSSHGGLRLCHHPRFGLSYAPLSPILSVTMDG
jgi:hypothetical protein